MYRKNVASQFLCFQGVDATTGGIKSGVTWTIRRSIDGTFAAGGGTVTEDGTAGWYKYAMSQADTNGNDISFNFTGSGAVPQTVNIITTACDPTVATNFGITSLPTTAVTTNASLITSGSGTDQLLVASGKVVTPDTQKVDVNTIKTNPVVNGGTITFPTNATLASTTNITAGTITTVTTVTNQLTAAAIATGVWTDTTAGDFTTALSVGKSLMNGVSLGTGLTVARCTLVDTLTTYTGNTVQTGDSFARIGAAGVGLTAVALADATSDAVIADAVWNAATATYGSAGSYGLLIETDLDATISSRGTSTLTQTQVSGGAYALNSASFAFNAALDFTTAQKAATLARVTLVDTVTTLTNLPAITAGWLTATGIAADAITAAKVAADVGVEIGGAVWDITLASHVTAGSTGFALNAAGSAGDPWGTALPGAYGAGTAGFIIGTNLDATVSSRLAPTVAGRTLDVSTGGEAGIDWANIGGATSTVGLTGTTIATTTVIASVTGAVGSVTGSVASVSGSVGSVTGSVGSVASGGITAASFAAAAITSTAAPNLDAAVTSRMATYTQPTGFLAATFPGTVASTTNITAATGIDVTKWAGTTVTAPNTAGTPVVDVVLWRGSAPTTLTGTGNVRVDVQAILANTTSPIGLSNMGTDYGASGYVNANVTAMAADTVTASALAASATAEIATAWGSSVVGNSRTRDMYLQGMTNKVAFDVPTAGSYTVYASDDTTALKVGTYTTAASDPVVSLDPA